MIPGGSLRVRAGWFCKLLCSGLHPAKQRGGFASGTSSVSALCAAPRPSPAAFSSQGPLGEDPAPPWMCPRDSLRWDADGGYGWLELEF